jgi:MFS family permease
LARSADVRLVAIPSVPSPESAPDRAATADSLPVRHVTRRVTIPAIVLGDAPTLDRRIWLLAGARFVVTAGFAAVMPFLAIHLAVERHFPILHIGLLWTVVGLVSASMQWLAGQVTDRLGRRRVLLTAMLLRSVNLAALGWAVGAQAALPVIVVLSIVNGAMRAFYDPAASAVVAALCSRDQRVAAFSLHRVGSSLGWTAGPLVVTFVPQASYSALFYVAAPLTLVAAAVVALIPETGPVMPKAPLRLAQLAEFARDRKFMRFLVATLPFFVLQTQMYHILPIYAAKHLGLDRTQIGSLFVINGVLVVLFQLAAVRFIQRVGTAGALMLGSLGYLLAYVGVGLASSYLGLFGCVVVGTLCEIVAVPAHQARITGLAPIDSVAGYVGMGGLVQGIAQTSGPIVGSFLIEMAPGGIGWILIGLLGLVAAAGFRRRVEAPAVERPAS